MKITNQIITVAGRRWKIREARSYQDAMNGISAARASGSVGDRSYLHVDGKVFTLADVVQVNSDNTERQPYTKAY